MKFAKLIVSTFVLTMMFSVFLLGHGQHAHAELSDCPEGAYHRMAPKGPAIVKDEDTGDFLFSGTFFKCKNCGDWIVVSGYPQSGGAIGDYITEGTITVSWSDTTSIKVNRDYVHYTKKSSLPGYRFYQT